MISFEQAQQAARAQVPVLPIETLPCALALGRVLARTVIAPSNLPAFNNAAMDGFAISAEQLALPPGTRVPVGRLQAAGDAPFALGQQACQIMTGALLPHGAVSVLPVEQVEVYGALGQDDGLHIQWHEAPVLGQHMRLAGEDVRVGQTVLEAGTVLHARHVMVLAALGVQSLAVYAAVKVGIICTGAELRTPGGPLLPGQIYNSNGAYLRAALPSMAAEVAFSRDISDDASAYLQAVQEAELAGCQIIISTGAVSMGVHDFVPHALAMVGAEVVYHKVRMRPGKPGLLARLASGALLFGLPGNPMSCAVGLRFFVMAAVRAMQGREPEPPLMAQLQHALHKKPDWCLIHKALLSINTQGQAQLEIVPGQESFRIAPFAQANCWAVLPEGISEIHPGTLLACYSNGYELWPTV